MNYKIILSFFFLVCVNLCHGQLNSWSTYTTPSVYLGKSMINEYLLATKYILADSKELSSVQKTWSYSSPVIITKVEITPLVKTIPANQILVYRGPTFKNVKVIIRIKSNPIIYKVQLFANKKFPKGDEQVEDILSPAEAVTDPASS